MAETRSRKAGGPEQPSDRSSPISKAEHDFERQARQPNLGIVAEFVEFLRTNKKWWLTPIIIVIVLLTLFGILGQSVIAPFIYPLF